MKKLSAVTFLSLPVNGSMRVMTTLPLSLWVDGRDSFLPRYGMAFRIYLDSTSTANQNFMQNLSGFFGCNGCTYKEILSKTAAHQL